MTALIDAHGVAVRFAQRWVVDAVDLRIEPRQIVTLIGPNGAGKSTLVRALLGLVKPQRGRITRAPDLRIGYMPQRLHLDPTFPLTVHRFLALAQPQPEDLSPVLQRLNIAHLQEQPMQQLSGGETQRVLLARALLRRPNLLVLDEPAQGVDLAGQAALYRLIAAIRDEYHCAVLMISHNLQLVMAATDQVICLNHHICCQGHPDEVTINPAYLELFGEQTEGLGIFTHHHDHVHNLHGDPVPDHKGHRHG